MNQENALQEPPADIQTTLGIGQNDHTRRRRRRWIGLGVVAVVLAGSIAVWWWQNGDGIQRISTALVTRGDLTVTVTATGKLEPVNQVDVGSELSGTIESVEVDFNDRVHKGQVLARLDTEQLEARVIQARASLQAAEAGLLEAQATALETQTRLRRQKSLLKQNLTSQEQLDTAEAAHSRARAAVESARAQVKLAEAALEADLTNLSKAVIVSPIDGIVLSREIEPGQTVAASFQTPVLFQLAEDLKQMELHVDVDEADVGQVEPGQKAMFSVDAYPRKTFSAEITTVHFAPKITQDVVTYESRLRVDNSALLLRPGMTATADIVVEQLADVRLIPNAALRFTPPESISSGEEGNKLVRSLLPGPPARTPPKRARAKAASDEQTVWVSEDGEIRPVLIRTGPTDGRHTAVLDGELDVGMHVVTDISSDEEQPARS